MKSTVQLHHDASFNLGFIMVFSSVLVLESTVRLLPDIQNGLAYKVDNIFKTRYKYSEFT